MFIMRGITLLTSALCAVSQVSAMPAPQAVPASAFTAATTGGYWLANADHSKDTVWGNSDTTYTVFRNVKSYGAVGDGTTDDTAAIQKAILDGGRCGWGCNQSTTTPAIIYFPAGTYLISQALNLAYYTQVIGDPTDLPTLKATSTFAGMAVLDADPYQYDAPGSPNWFTNQNNFFRQIRNFKIDLTATTAGAGIHWQVAQATSIQNVIFEMTPGGQQIGIFMDNGSGGWFSDLTFNGGKIGAFLGSQQFTTRNLLFNGCQTAIYMNWNWGWTLSNITVTGATVGVDMANVPTNQTVGSVVISDSTISATYGVNSSFTTAADNVPFSGGTLVIDNVDFSGAQAAAVWAYRDNSAVLAPGKITAWAQGNGYVSSSTPVDSRQGSIVGAQKSANLLDPEGKIFGREKPQYETETNIMTAKSNGCHGTGEDDDTANVQNFLDAASTAGAVAYFEHGAYLVKDTIKVPKNVKIVGEIWPLIVADSASFSNSATLKPVFQIGQVNDAGSVEISDMLFSTNGPAAGAVMVEWNLNCAQGACGMWDTHVRIGGSANSNLQQAQCPGNPTTEPQSQCYGVGLMFHATPSSGGVYLENTWFWVADHDMEVNNQTQISIYSPRGALFQSQSGPTWLWGTASEHSMFYNYQVDGVNGFFGGFMQSETPYFQPNPLSPGPFTFDATLDDPTFANCQNGSDVSTAACEVAWGLRVVNSHNVVLYSTGFYSFFQNYDQSCVSSQNCQTNMIQIQGSQVDMYAVTTKAAINMIVDDSISGTIKDADNRDNFGATLAYYFTGH